MFNIKCGQGVDLGLHLENITEKYKNFMPLGLQYLLYSGMLNISNLEVNLSIKQYSQTFNVSLVPSLGYDQSCLGN